MATERLDTPLETGLAAAGAETVIPAQVPGSAAIVEVHEVSKRYAHGAGRKLLRDHFRGFFRVRPSGTFYALREVSFRLNPGESLGIMGPNGAGKSTLLGLISGITHPDEGRVAVSGSIAALLELGSGFHPDLTGRENVLLNASLLGLSRKQTRERFDHIVDFSEIGDFIDEPLRTYSNGMVLRLAFSVAVNTNPDILIIDEVLAVGDQHFQAKCIKRIFELKDSGKTLIFVSHSAQLLQNLCDKCLWLDHGRTVMLGEAQAVIDAYQSRATASAGC